MFNGGGHHFGSVLNGSFTMGDGGVCGQVSGTSSSHFGSVLDWLRDSPADDLKRWKSRNDSVGSGGGRVGVVMFNFSGPNFGSVQNGMSPKRNRLNGDYPGSSSGCVSCQVSGTGGGNFGRFLDGRWLSRVRIVKERIVIPTGRDLS
jgi:hypothetical protein